MSWTSAYLKISILFVEDLELSIQYYCQFGMDEIFLTMHISINIYSFSSLRISVGLQELCLESFGIKATAEQCSQMEKHSTESKWKCCHCWLYNNDFITHFFHIRGMKATAKTSNIKML